MTAVPIPTHTAGRLEGECRRDEGMALAAANHQILIWRCQLALLDVIRSRPDRTASTDDATENLWRRFLNGGKWRGEVTRGLARLGLIRKAGVITSARPSRLAGYLSLWQGINDAAIDAHRAQLRRCLAAIPSPDVIRQESELFN